jgi:hypothetical protein
MCVSWKVGVIDSRLAANATSALHPPLTCRTSVLGIESKTAFDPFPTFGTLVHPSSTLVGQSHGPTASGDP